MVLRRGVAGSVPGDPLDLSLEDVLAVFVSGKHGAGELQIGVGRVVRTKHGTAEASGRSTDP